jgi:hypothetical protein
MLLLCTGGSPPSYFLPYSYKGLFLVCLKVLRLLFICSLFNCSREQSLHSSDVEIQPMDIADDMYRYVWFTGTSNHHSLFPPSGRTSSFRSRNDFIHKSFIHRSSSQLSVPLLDCF